MSRLSNKIKQEDLPIKGVTASSNGSFSGHDGTNIQRKDDNRSRSWTCIVYPGDSLPENWKEILGDLMIPWAISPLHDEDLNPYGEKKKVHRHLLLSFYTLKSYSQIEEITKLLGAPSPQACRDTRGLVRYFLHMDHPEKAQYKRENIEFGGGFDLENALKASVTEEKEVLNKLCAFIREHLIMDFCDLDEYVRTQRQEWCFILEKKTYYLNTLIKSQWLKYRNKTNNQTEWGDT